MLEQDRQKNELYVELLRTNPRAKLRARKRSHALLVSQGSAAARKQVSMSLDQPGFTHLVGKNSMNVKYRGPADILQQSIDAS